MGGNLEERIVMAYFSGDTFLLSLHSLGLAEATVHRVEGGVLSELLGVVLQSKQQGCFLALPLHGEQNLGRLKGAWQNANRKHICSSRAWH